MLKDNLNKKSADFFEENAHSYSKENYDKSLNIFMFERMKSILEMTKKNLVKENKVNLLTPYLIDSIIGDKKVDSITLKNFETNEIESYEADELLFLFGLNKKLGPILDWNIDLNGKKIKVNTENYQTSKEGIFAVGDINDYPGKLDLILSGFHETTLAVQEAYKRIYPGERVPFGYTTSNSKLQEKLGVKK